jgi:hypothetical protein
VCSKQSGAVELVHEVVLSSRICIVAKDTECFFYPWAFKIIRIFDILRIQLFIQRERKVEDL